MPQASPFFFWFWIGRAIFIPTGDFLTPLSLFWCPAQLDECRPRKPTRCSSLNLRSGGTEGLGLGLSIDIIQLFFLQIPYSFSFPTRSPVVPTFTVSFLREGSPTKIDYSKKGYPY